MGARGVSLVAVPAITGVLGVEAKHVVVAIGLGENGSGGNREIGGIAFDHGGVGNARIGAEAVAVDEQVLGAEGEGCNGAVHGQEGGVEDVDAVDFFGRDHAHGPGQGFALDDGAEGVALAFGELLRVVQQFVAEAGGQDDGGGIDGARQASASGFVAAGFYLVSVQRRQ